MIKNKNIKNIIWILFLSLFSLLVVNNIVFTHYHVINNETIVHSHPFNNTNKSPNHKHSSSELFFINNLNILIGETLFCFIFFQKVVNFKFIINISSYFKTNIYKFSLERGHLFFLKAIFKNIFTKKL